MLVEKVFNNNVILSRDENDNDVVVMGCGIAFQKRPGDTVDHSRIEKVFRQVDKDMTSRLVALLSEIPLEYFTLTEEIIKDAKLRLGKKLNDNIVISLTDHIFFALKRYHEGHIIKNGLLWETKRLYREEYEIGRRAVALIGSRYDVQLPDDEAAFIAMHLINAHLDEEIPTVVEMTKVMKGVLEIVRIHFMVPLDEESISYYRFVTHLKFFSQRLVTGNLYNESTDLDLFNFVKVKYPESFACTEKIYRFIQGEFNYGLSAEEMLYITVHIERLVKNTTK